MDDLMSLDWDANANANATPEEGNNVKNSHSHLGTNQSVKSNSKSNFNSNSNSTYNFDSLTRTLNNSSPNPSSISISISNSNNLSSKQSQPQGSSRNIIPSATLAPSHSSSSSDAFSSLLSFNSNSNQSTSTMTLAERQSRFESDRREKQERERRMNEARWGNGAGWDSIESKASKGTGISNSILSATPSPALAPSPPLVPSTSTKPSPAISTSSSNPQDPWDFDSLPTSTTIASSNTSSSKSNSHQSQPRSGSGSKTKPKSQDPFDFDSFEDPGDGQESALGGEGFDDELDLLGEGYRSSKSKPQVSRQASVGEDDILGALAGPAQPQSQTRTDRLDVSESSTSSRVPSPADGSRSQLQSRKGGPHSSSASASTRVRTSSPPPHIVGQLVEMGFGPMEARKALAQTESGLDVQAAAEILVGGAAGSNARKAENREGDQGERSEEERDRQLAWEIQKQEEERERKQSRRFGNGGGRESSNQAARNGRRPQAAPRDDSGRNRDESGTSTPEWQKQADQLYNQAQEIGSTVFSKANAFWSSAKAQAQKALEERAAASQNSGGESGRSSPATAGSERARARRWGTASNSRADRTKEWEGKPRWMVEAEEAEEREAAAAAQDSHAAAEDATAGGFKDSDEEQEQARPPPNAAAGKGVESGQPRKATVEAPKQQNGPDIWDTPPDTSSSSSSSSKTRPQPGLSSSGSTSRSSRPTQPPPAPKVSRDLIPEDQDDSAAFISKVSQLKLSGNECFKKGSYGDAEQFYSKALELLPENSLRRVPLLNNRSNSRLKNGDSRNAIRDCSEVLSIILPNQGASNPKSLVYNPNSDSNLPRHLTSEINLRDSWSKALLRKAQAEEILEKWVSARTSWSNLERFEKDFGSGKSGVQNMRASRDGIARCEKMMSGGGKGMSSENGTSNSNSNPQTKSAAASRASKSAAEAIKRAEAAGRERVRAENAAADAEDAAKFALKDKVDERINEWKKGKENNVRALIASVDSMTWNELNWKKIGMHELITDAQVKKGYTRAIAKLHPDKLTPKNSNLEQRMIAAGVFSVLNDAWIASQN